MIAVIQRVAKADVSINSKTRGEIGKGLLILLGVAVGDKEEDADFLVNKICGLRIFSDDDGKMNISLKDSGGSALIISQFTLCGDWRKGRRPSFTKAAKPEEGNRLYEYFCRATQEQGIHVETGEFAAMMNVSLINEGPVTFVLDSKQK
ncbi:MAG: D-aminoacyl-tRNA deacylase [Candidatus Neomarinimicrobiota bacterium]